MHVHTAKAETPRSGRYGRCQRCGGDNLAMVNGHALCLAGGVVAALFNRLMHSVAQKLAHFCTPYNFIKY